MSKMRYYAPVTLAAARELLGQLANPTLLAGGTDLLVRHSESLVDLGDVVDVSKIPDLKGIQVDSQVILGAAVTHGELTNDPSICQLVPFLSEAAVTVGAPQIQHRGTIGGNLANASPAADLAPPLIVLDAMLTIAGKERNRHIKLANLFLGPGKTSLQPGEIIVDVRFPLPGKYQAGSYLKIGQRKALAISVVGIAVFVTLNSTKDTLTDIKVAVGSVAPTPLRCEKTEQVLKGHSLSRLPWAKAKQTLAEEIRPIDDIRASAEYRREVAQVALTRMIQQAVRHLEVKIHD